MPESSRNFPRNVLGDVSNTIGSQRAERAPKSARHTVRRHQRAAPGIQNVEDATVGTTSDFDVACSSTTTSTQSKRLRQTTSTSQGEIVHHVVNHYPQHSEGVTITAIENNQGDGQSPAVKRHRHTDVSMRIQNAPEHNIAHVVDVSGTDIASTLPAPAADAVADAVAAQLVEDEDPMPSVQHTTELSTGVCTQPLRPRTDIDLRRVRHVKFCSQYAMDIYTYFKDIEVPKDLLVDYIGQIQHDVDAGMRAIMVDWLVEVTEEYRLMPETLYAAVQLTDRILSKVAVKRTQLQLLACACMLIAAKWEEIYRIAPTVKDFVFIADNTYTNEEVIAMETTALKLLDFKIRAVTPKTYMSRYLRAAQASHGDLLTNLVKYLTELTLPEYRFLKYRASTIIASAILCARKILKYSEIWTSDLQYYTGYTQSDLLVCAEDIAQAHRDATTNILQAIREKYSHSAYARIAVNARVQTLAAETFYSLGHVVSSASSAAGVRCNQFS